MVDEASGHAVYRIRDCQVQRPEACNSVHDKVMDGFFYCKFSFFASMIHGNENLAGFHYLLKVSE